MSLKHSKQSTKPDGSDTSLIRPSDWNADHVFAGGANGSLLARATGDPSGAAWVPAALGFLAATAAGQTPTFRALIAGDIPALPYVPTSRTVNGHALTGDVTVSKSDVGLGNVEDTALTTWAGSTAITTTGVVSTGTWSGLFGAVSGASLTHLTPANIDAGTAGINISGNAATATSAITAGSASTATLAAAATVLATSRAIYGNNFDGSAALTQTIAVGFGGTGISSYAVGDIPYASGATTLSKLADVATGSVLISGGVGAAPAWSTTPTLSSILFSGGQSIVGTETNALVFPVAGQFVWGSVAASGVSQWAWSLGGNYAPTYASVAGFLRMTPNITMPNAVAGGFAELRGYSQQPTFNIAGKTGTVLEINGAEYDAPVISNGANMTVQDLHNVYIYGALLRGAATLTGKEYAFRVGRAISGVGPSRFEDDIFLTPQTGLVTAVNTVTMSFTGNVLSLLNGTKAAGANLVIGDGTPSAPSLTRFGQATGLSFTSNNVRISHSGTVGYDMTNGRFTMYQNIQMGFSVGSGTADAIIGRSAANALKLMNAGEDTGVSVDFSVQGILHVKSLAALDTAIIKAKTHQASAGAFSTVPASPVEGQVCAVTDSTTSTPGATVTGGGSNHILAYYNGTNWKVII